MNSAPHRILAIDWSGDKTIAGQRKKIWIADSNQGNLTLTNGRTREETAAFLVGAAKQTPELVVGLDFAFSFPAWFVREQACANAEEFWQLIASGKGEQWLSQPNAFCWGRTGIHCPMDHRAPGWKGFRQTDRELNIAGIQPKSPFQIGGAGAVGTGSLRGIPFLHQLRQVGFSIWPFNQRRFPIAMEIYPRVFTGPGNKSSLAFRTSSLEQNRYRELPEEILAKARGSEDAFDALCSAIGMKDHAEEFLKLKRASHPVRLLEGQIWTPGQH
jgi:hypothetical protein